MLLSFRTVDIDIKLLRWVSEIVADGSEIRSLAGRSARLGDGTSRNPRDRDALVEQRTKDLQGMIGQVRGFDLDEFLSDWEPQGEAIPWAVGNDGWVNESQNRQPSAPCQEPAAGAAEPMHLHRVMTEAGVSPTLKVLYVPDYMPVEQRTVLTSQLYVRLSQLLPEYTVLLRRAPSRTAKE